MILQDAPTNRLIFVGGAPRSGTTLVQNILDCHPEICAAPEFHVLRKFMNLKNTMVQLSERGIIDGICTIDEIEANFRWLICNFLIPLADRENKRFISEKTPENILIFEDLIRLLPEAYFIFVIRDPRAVVASLKKVKERARREGVMPPRISETLLASIIHTERCLRAGFQAVERNRDKILVVSFERLLDAPEEETKKICRFLHVPWTEELLMPGLKEHRLETSITEAQNNIWYDKKMIRRNIDSSAKESWKNNLSNLEVATIEYKLIDLAEKLSLYGYHFEKRVSGFVKLYLIAKYAEFGFKTLQHFRRKFFERLSDLKR